MAIDTSGICIGCGMTRRRGSPERRCSRYEKVFFTGKFEAIPYMCKSTPFVVPKFVAGVGHTKALFNLILFFGPGLHRVRLDLGGFSSNPLTPI